MDHPLRPWLEKQERNGAWLARRLGVTRSAVHQWLSGLSRPSTDRMLAIEELTEGEVTMADLTRWGPEDEKSSPEPDLGVSGAPDEAA